MKVIRDGDAARIVGGTFCIQFDAPVGVSRIPGGRPDAVFCCSSALSRVAGLVELTAVYDSLWVGIPFLDPRAARLVEAVQQVWEIPVDVDLLQPGFELPVGPLRVTTVGLTEEDRPCLGFQVTNGERMVVIVPDCEPDGGLRRALRGADEVVLMGSVPGSAWHAWMGDAVLHIAERC